MLFNVETDIGNEVVVYLVGDDFSAIPKLLVKGGGGEFEIEANEIRESLVQAGRHQTGRCGFRLNALEYPEISSLDLELRDASTGVLIYRRRQEGVVDRKILRLETHLLPLWRFDMAIAPFFQYSMRQIEHFGRETTTQMFLMNNLTSQYLAGRISYKSFEYFIDGAFSIWICLQPPYHELAERLLFLKNVRKIGLTLLSERDRLSLVSVINFAENLPYSSPKDLKRALVDMPKDIAAKLSNPLTRQLTTTGPDDMPSGGAVATALDILASCELIGFRGRDETFTSFAARLIDIDPVEVPSVGATAAMIGDLALALEESGAAKKFLEKDLELFYYVTLADQAVERHETK